MVCPIHLHHGLIWISYQIGQVQTATESNVCREHNQGWLSLHLGRVPVQGKEMGTEHLCRTFTPCTQAIQTSPIWEAPPSLMCQNQLSQRQLPPPDCHSAELAIVTQCQRNIVQYLMSISVDFVWYIVHILLNSVTFILFYFINLLFFYTKPCLHKPGKKRFSF